MFETESLWIQALSQNFFYLMINTKFIIFIIDCPMESLSITISTKDSSLGQAKNIKALSDKEYKELNYKFVLQIMQPVSPFI